MNESFVLLVLALGLTLGTILGSSNGENLENNDKVESNPAMSCLLFGNEGCNIGCAITGQLFNNQSRGVCDSDQLCTCQSKGKTAFRDLWKERFNSESVFDNIRRRKPVYTNVFGIFRSNMFKTNEELKQSLESVISPYQFSILETNDQYPAAKYTKDGKFDKEALRKYVSEKLDEELKSKSARALLDVKYKEIFRKALETYKPCKASMFNYTFKVKQLKNKQLDIMLEEFFKENSMKKPKIEIPTDHEPINRIVSNIVVNELINRIEGESDVEIDRDVNPSISCLLFGNDVCNDVCVYYANLMNFQTSGICDSDDICTCYNHKHKKIDESQRPAVERTDNGKFDEKALVKYPSWQNISCTPRSVW